jgi:prophage regulatory protein
MEGLDECLQVVEESKSREVRGLSPLLLRTAEAAALCKVSTRTWRGWDAAGKIPKPIRIGRSTLWRSEELHAWAAAGCPRRQQWEDKQL